MYKLKELHALLLTGLKPNRFYNQKRLISKNREKKAVANINRALDYYDSVYPPIYGPKKWSKMKKALFKDAKYVALINNFTDNEEVINSFEELGVYDVGAFYTKQAKCFNENYPDFKNTFASNQQTISEPQGVRPSLIQLTEDEKAEAARLDEIERYPEEYKKRALGKLDMLQDCTNNITRLIKASQVPSNLESLTFDHILPTKLKGCEDWMEETDVFRGFKNTDEEIGAKRIMEEEPITWPKNLKVFSFLKGDTEGEFPSPKPSKIISAFTHYLLNGASILPVLALDIQRGDSVLDMCASPGGKSLAILQTHLPSILVSNDISTSRLYRIKDVFEQYIPKGLSSVWDSVDLTNKPGQMVMNPDFFDRVLVDAPCLNDRLSLKESDNSIFKPGRVKERLHMPELQAELILAALKYTKPGGCVVYSTCTLSPLQNDGAVHLALTRVWRETQIDCTVVNMMPTLKNLNFMYSVGHDLKLRYGHVVLPFVENNCGPMYVCKIIRDR